MPYIEDKIHTIDETYRDLNLKFGLIKNVRNFSVAKSFNVILNAWPGFI